MISIKVSVNVHGIYYIAKFQICKVTFISFLFFRVAKSFRISGKLLSLSFLHPDHFHPDFLKGQLIPPY